MPPETTDSSLHALLQSAAVFAPMVVALLLWIIPGLSKGAAKGLALSGFVIPAVSAFGYLALICSSPLDAGFIDGGTLGFFGLADFGFSLSFGLNGISMPLFILAGIVGLAAGLYALQQEVERARTYYALLLFMVGGLMGAFASTNLVFFYFFHEVALIPTFVLIGIWGSENRRVAAMEMTIYLTVGAMLSLLGLIALYVQSGASSFEIQALQAQLAERPILEQDQGVLFALLLFGFGILVSLFPFHTWAPRGYAAAPAPAAMLHAGALKKFGLYGLIQVALPFLPQGAVEWSGWLLWLALGNVLIIGLVTIGQRDLKQMIGYASVMHMGYAFLGIVAFNQTGLSGALFIMVAHGLSVSLLFMLADAIEKRSGTQDMLNMGGLGSQAPMLGIFFVAATMASIGLPGFANFWGELAVFLGLWQAYPYHTVAVVLGIIISAVYGLRAAARIFMGQPTPAMQTHAAKTPPKDLVFGERLPALILLVTLLGMGFWPKSVSQSIHNAVAELYPEMPAEVAEVALEDEEDPL